MVNASAHTTIATTAARRVVDMPSTFAAPDARFAARPRRSRALVVSTSPVRRRAASGRRARADPPVRAASRRLRALPRSAMTCSGLGAEPREGQLAGVPGGVAGGLLDAQQLVVLRDPLAAGRSAGLDLADAGGDRQVG